jgi:hypothetical protein
MEQWRKQSLGDVQATGPFYAAKREERRADQRRRGDFIEAEVDKPGPSMFDDEDPRWDDLWTETTFSDDE